MTESDSKVISLQRVKEFKQASEMVQKLWVTMMDRGMVKKTDPEHVLAVQFSAVAKMTDRQADMAMAMLEKWGFGNNIKKDFEEATAALQVVKFCFATKLEPMTPRF